MATKKLNASDLMETYDPSNTRNNLSNQINNRDNEKENNKLEKEISKRTDISQMVTLSLKVDSNEKEEWLDFCKQVDFSMSIALRKAMRYYIQQYKAGNIEI